MRNPWLLLILLATAGDGFGQSPQVGKALVLRNVTVIDGTGAAARPETTVVVQNGRIGTIGKASEVVAPESAQVIARWKLRGRDAEARRDDAGLPRSIEIHGTRAHRATDRNGKRSDRSSP